MTTAVQVQYRRDSAANVASFTGAAGEMVIDTTNNRVVVQDGSTAGGFPAAKLSETVANTRTQVSDGNYTVLTTDRTIAYITLTGARTVSLPAASTFPTGTRLLVMDESGACSATDTITLSAAGADTIDGAASAVINSAYGYIALQSNGLNKWTVTDQASAMWATAPAAGDSSARAINSAWHGQNLPGGSLNKFRNGTMDVWQRGTSALAVSATTVFVYTADGWMVAGTYSSGAGPTVAPAAGRLTTKNSLQVTGAANVSDVKIKQRIESLIAAAFCSQTVTVQAQVYNNTGGAITPTLTVNRPSAENNYTSVTADVNAVNLQACATGAWTQVAYTFSANAASYNGLEILFDFGNNFSATGKDIQITECDIRVTPGVATGLNANPPPPELRLLPNEIEFCERYFRKSNALNTAPGGSIAGGTGGVYFGGASGVINSVAIYLGRHMRVNPTIVIYDNAGTSGKVSYYTTGWNNNGAATILVLSDCFFNINANIASTYYYNFDYTASAEL